MLAHQLEKPATPSRIVVIGSSSFVGKALLKRLAADKCDVAAVGRAEVDLTAADAGERLAAQLRPEDSVVAISAKAFFALRIGKGQFRPRASSSFWYSMISLSNRVSLIYCSTGVGDVTTAYYSKSQKMTHRTKIYLGSCIFTTTVD
mgnify:CR=1 FL=1